MIQIDLQLITDIVRAASARMDRTGGFEIHDKGVRENIVTSSDLAVQHYLTTELRRHYPEIGFLCEEEDLNEVSGHARGNENCCISVALVEKCEPVLGVVYSPWRDELYTAEKGKGAFLNGKPIHVSDRPFEQGLLFTAMSTYRKDLSRYCSDIIYDLYMACNDVRRTGSAAVELCLMAAGFAELYFEIRLMPWDYAAASLILQEAGGYVCDFDGERPSPFKPSMFIAANTKESCMRILEAVHRHLRELPY